MIKKSAFKCESCNRTYLRWESPCRDCGLIDSIKETENSAVATDSARRIRRRAKDAERAIAKRMTAVDGPDPKFRNIASSTGRIGHITGMQVDAVSLTYVIEEKNRKIPTWMSLAWLKINQKGILFGKNILFHLTPPNNARDFIVEGQRHKLDTMAVITQTRHEDLIKTEKVVVELENKIFNDEKYSELQDIFWRLKK